jgi:transposase-like protein
MNRSNIYKRYRFSSVILQHAVWLYYRFNLSHRDIADLLAERGINVTYEAIHDTSQYANNRAELSHQSTRVRERGMRRFKSVKQARQFLNVRAAVYNLFNLGHHLISAKHYRLFRMRSFASWKSAVV